MQETVTDLVLWFLGEILVVPTFVARCLNFCIDAREPSGKK